jgi:hypothetical protein
MQGETTMRTTKPMPLTVSQIATARASLRSEGRVDQQNWDAQHLPFVANTPKQQTMRKLVQPTVDGFVAFLALLKLQVLQSQNSIRSSPYNEALGNRLAVGLGEVSLAERQPFQQSADTPCVLALCLRSANFFCNLALSCDASFSKSANSTRFQKRLHLSP